MTRVMVGRGFSRTSSNRRATVYVCAADSPALASHLAFRDVLRGDPGTARAYAQLKRSLASQFRDDRRAYTEAKTAFIEQVLATSAAETPAPGDPRG